MARLQSAMTKVELAAAFLSSEHFVARLIEGHQSAVIRANSPWLNRQDAADYARCGVSEIDRQANLGVLKRHPRGGVPLFKKIEIDRAIESGRWTPATHGKAVK